ncbi:hypothetical protein PENFLA_c062G07162 [Penicillium flavigenum]|uniref:Reverse transcriptase domain-containing protein n=1 Tax=Penicillium flavigenum TaxID=254877 RepID=A0A1V6SG94_9EURO|nr:hypothetical protein PENFLA_c062G07162 [Penicillium flavigenum]
MSLAQGPSLSPILFSFFNADLVDQPVDSHGGASVFIDDYFRWRVGGSVKENLVKIQSEDVPRMQRIDSQRKLRNRARPIHSGHCCRGRTHLYAIKFMLNGGWSGSRAPKARTYERLTTPYRRGAPENYMGIYPGTARISLHRYARATAGDLLARRNLASATMICASAARRGQYFMY